MDNPINLNTSNVYEITVIGDIDLSWLKELGEVNVQTRILSGGRHQSTLSNIIIDQAGLVGLIRRIHGLGIVLLSIRQV